MLGVAVRRVRREQQVALLGLGRHAGRRAAALDVEQHGRDLGEVREADELLHQRDAGARGGRERARAVPAGADDHPDRRELILGLDEGETVAAGVGLGAKAPAVPGVGLGQRRRRRDRVPRADGGAAVDGAQTRRAVAVDEDPLADAVAALDPEPDRLEVVARVVEAQAERVAVGVEQRRLVLAAELHGEEPVDDFGLDAEDRGERADVHHVLEQLPLADVRVRLVADVGQRHAQQRDVVPQLRVRQRLGRVVEHEAARLDLGEVGLPGLRIHRDHQLDAAAPAAPAGLDHADLVPGRHALDVRREDVARRDRHAHPQDRLGEQAVGRGGTRAVDVGELDDEIVGALDLRHGATPRRLRRARRARGGPAGGSGACRRRATSRSGTSSCPRRRSGSARRTDRSAGTRPRP